MDSDGSIYPAQDEFKASFLSELVRTCQQNPYPTLLEGDFNIMRNSREKNNNRFNARWPFLFNAVIDSFDLREIDLAGRQYTWANSLAEPTYEKLDRVLMMTEWEFKYPLVTVHALDRGVSDHTPLLLDTVGITSSSKWILAGSLMWISMNGWWIYGISLYKGKIQCNDGIEKLGLCGNTCGDGQAINMGCTNNRSKIYSRSQ